MEYFKEPINSMYERLHEAFTNSFDVIVKKKDPYPFIEEEGDVVFAHDIAKPLRIDQLHYMLGYWENVEEYEKCAELKNLIDELERLSTRDL